MAPVRRPPMPGLASLAASWHIWKLGSTLGQELLGQSKNIAGKLEGTVPEAGEERGTSMFAQAYRELVAGPGAGLGISTKGLLAPIPKQARENVSALGREIGESL